MLINSTKDTRIATNLGQPYKKRLGDKAIIITTFVDVTDLIYNQNLSRTLKDSILNEFGPDTSPSFDNKDIEQFRKELRKGLMLQLDDSADVFFFKAPANLCDEPVQQECIDAIRRVNQTWMRDPFIPVIQDEELSLLSSKSTAHLFNSWITERTGLPVKASGFIFEGGNILFDPKFVLISNDMVLCRLDSTWAAQHNEDIKKFNFTSSRSRLDSICTITSTLSDSLFGGKRVITFGLDAASQDSAFLPDVHSMPFYHLDCNVALGGVRGNDYLVFYAKSKPKFYKNLSSGQTRYLQNRDSMMAQCVNQLSQKIQDVYPNLSVKLIELPAFYQFNGEAVHCENVYSLVNGIVENTRNHFTFTTARFNFPSSTSRLYNMASIDDELVQVEKSQRMKFIRLSEGCADRAGIHCLVLDLYRTH